MPGEVFCRAKMVLPLLVKRKGATRSIPGKVLLRAKMVVLRLLSKGKRPNNNVNTASCYHHVARFMTALTLPFLFFSFSFFFSLFSILFLFFLFLFLFSSFFISFFLFLFFFPLFLFFFLSRFLSSCFFFFLKKGLRQRYLRTSLSTSRQRRRLHCWPCRPWLWENSASKPRAERASCKTLRWVLVWETWHGVAQRDCESGRE